MKSAAVLTESESVPASVSPDRPEPAVRPRFLPTALAVSGGLLLWLAFPPYDLVLLAVAGPAALSLAVHGRGPRAGAWLGLVFGLAFLLPHLSWSGVYVGAMPWLLLAGWQATYLGLLGAGLAVVQRLPLWPVWAAALWVAEEALRSRWFLGGFPWGRLGFSQADGPFTAYAAYGGVPLLGFVVALTGTLLAAAIALAGHRRAVALALSGALALPVLGVLLAAGLPTGGTGSVTVAVVQGNVPRAGLDFNAQRRAVLDNHVGQTVELADRIDAGEVPRPDFVVWPENSSDIDPYRNEDAAAQIDRAARAVGVPILVGAVARGPGDNVRNLGIVWDPVDGPGQTYLKRHPVPFGEYIPWRSAIEDLFPIVDRVRSDHVGGDRPGLLELAGTPVGDVICFEVAYDGLVRDVAGAGLLVVQTNNATFGYTGQSYQQLAMSRIRAVEHGRTVLVAATSGVSAIIAPDGTVTAQSQLYTPEVFVADVPLRSEPTVATRLGAAPEWVLTGLGVGALLVGLGLLVRSRR